MNAASPTPARASRCVAGLTRPGGAPLSTGVRTWPRPTPLVGALLALMLTYALGCRSEEPDALRGAALLEALPARPDLALRAGRVVWTSSGGAYRVRVGRPGHALEVELANGAGLEVDWALSDPAFSDPLAELPSLLAHLPAGALDRAAAPPRLRFDPLSEGMVLDASPSVVEARALVRPTGPDEPLREVHARARDAIAAARAELEAWLLTSSLDASSRAALREVVARAERDDAAGEAEQEDYPSSDFVRRLLRAGWLDTLTGDDPRAAHLRRAVTEATQLRASTVLRAPAIERRVLEDAFGRRVHTRRTPTELRYQLDLPGPAYFGDVAPLELVVELPPDAEALDPDAPLRAARVYQGGVRVAEWSRERGFVAHAEAWKARAAPDLDTTGGWVLPGALPPHVLVVTPLGDVRRLVTAHGSVTPTRASDAAAVERFLEEAARALPDAAHLDLLGQYLYAYVHDSPDARRPELLGTATRLGDIHQTAAQTLATATGGRYRGDCDDLSELYQEIARRQGRNAHLVGLPSHAALAWVEKTDARFWTYVLQTAPPLAVPGETLEASLEETYRSFDPDAAVDAEQLEILLRFAGENTRDGYILSADVFADARYARTMIDLQADWHRFRFGAALDKVERLLEQDPTRVAHLLERASLESATSQPARAARTYALARAHARSPVQRIQITTRELESLFDAGQPRRALALLDALEARMRAELEDPTSGPALELWTQLADALLDDDRAPDRALDLLASYVAPAIRRRQSWYRSEEDRDRIEGVMELSVEALRSARRRGHAEGASWDALTSLLDEWFETGVLARPDASESVLRAYGWLGRHHEAVHGERAYRALVEAQEPPASADRAHALRAEEDVRARRDAAWVAISPYYWWKALGDGVAWHADALDPTSALEIAYRVRLARAQAEALGLDHPEFAAFVLHAEMVSAVAARDPGRLRAALREVHAARDRELVAGAAYWVAQLGRRIPLETFLDYLEIVHEELDSPGVFLRIAWQQIAADAWDHALGAVARAVRAYPDDVGLEGELRFMRALWRARVGSDPASVPEGAQEQVTDVPPQEERPLAAEHAAGVRARDE